MAGHLAPRARRGLGHRRHARRRDRAGRGHDARAGPGLGMHRNEGLGHRRGRGRRRTGHRRGHRLAGRVEQFRLPAENEGGRLVAIRRRLAVPPVLVFPLALGCRANAQKECAQKA